MSNGSSIKRYKVCGTWESYEVTLEVDHDILTPERATELNNFWSSSKSYLSEENGDVVRTVIRNFGAWMLRHMLSEGGADFTETSYNGGFGSPGPEWTKDIHNEEGWGGEEEGNPYGWCGIRCVASASIDHPGFYDVELSEVGHEA